MIEIIGPSVSPFVVKLLAAADYKGFPYTHTEHVSIRELAKLNPQTGKVPVVRFDGETTYDTDSPALRRGQPDPPSEDPHRDTA